MVKFKLILQENVKGKTVDLESFVLDREVIPREDESIRVKGLNYRAVTVSHNCDVNTKKTYPKVYAFKRH